jgi:hypothetical protein
MGRRRQLDGPDWGCGDGFCACGCGQRTPLATVTRTERGQIIGRPIRFIHGHNGLKHGNAPYRQRGRKREHVVIAEQALGKPLPKGACVHHVDGNGKNNAPGNLVICQNQAYHTLLHQRQRAMDACGDPSALRCFMCHGYGRQEDIVGPSGRTVHRECRRERFRNYMAARRQNGQAA